MPTILALLEMVWVFSLPQAPTRFQKLLVADGSLPSYFSLARMGRLKGGEGTRGIFSAGDAVSGQKPGVPTCGDRASR